MLEALRVGEIKNAVQLSADGFFAISVPVKVAISFLVDKEGVCASSLAAADRRCTSACYTTVPAGTAKVERA